MYLTELLLENGYRVHGQYRQEDGTGNPASSFPASLMESGNFRPLAGSVANPGFAHDAVRDIRPDEIYYLASNHALDFFSQEL